MADIKQFDFSRFTDANLMQLARQLEVEIARRRAKQKRLRHQQGGRFLADAGPKYRNPLNSAETWSGRGKRPLWFAKALARGYPLADLRIDREVRPGHLASRRKL